MVHWAATTPLPPVAEPRSACCSGPDGPDSSARRGWRGDDPSPCRELLVLRSIPAEREAQGQSQLVGFYDVRIALP